MIESTKIKLSIGSCVLLTSVTMLLSCKSFVGKTEAASSFTSRQKESQYLRACADSLNLELKDFPTITTSSLGKFGRVTRAGATGRAKAVLPPRRTQICLNPDGAGNAAKKSCIGVGASESVGTVIVLNRNDSPVYFTIGNITVVQRSQIIAHHPASGHTCYFEAEGQGKGKRIDLTSADGIDLDSHLLIAGRTCVDCHSPSPYIKSPFIHSKQLHELAGLKLAPLKANRDFEIGDESLLSAWADSDFNWLEAMNGSRRVLVQGAPVSAVKNPEGKWVHLKHEVVSVDLLVKGSKASADQWKPNVLAKGTVPACQSCHELANAHVNARLAGTVAGLCSEPQLNEQICYGFDSRLFEGFANGKTLHEVLYNQPFVLSKGQRKNLIEYVDTCTTLNAGCEKLTDK